MQRNKIQAARSGLDNSLLARRPDVAAWWHRTKNGKLRPSAINTGSHRRVWWQCPKSRAHVWLTTPKGRTSQNSGCPFCMGRYVARDTSLAARAPKVAAQWHRRKNGKLTPWDVSPGSERKVWWTCPRDAEHVWQTRVAERRRSGCPYCAGRKASAATSLAARFPRLAHEWHLQKNGTLRPRDVVPGSARTVWWRCAADRNHEWQEVINKRVAGRRCPFCYGRSFAPHRRDPLALEAPELAGEWHPTKNGDLTPFDVLTGSSRRVWWKCPEGSDHEWQASPTTRSHGHGCPFCSGRRVSIRTALAITRPSLAAEWHPTKNNELTPWKVTAGSHKRVWWRCARDPRHEWSAQIHGRRGCPICYRTRGRPQATTRRVREVIRFPGDRE